MYLHMYWIYSQNWLKIDTFDMLLFVVGNDDNKYPTFREIHKTSDGYKWNA